MPKECVFVNAFSSHFHQLQFVKTPSRRKILIGFPMKRIINLCNCQLLCHSVSLFTRGKSPKFPMTSNHRQNCSIGQPFSKKWFFRRVSLDPGENARGSRGRSGASWRHLEALNTKCLYYILK